jgi:hypothetical protein
MTYDELEELHNINAVSNLKSILKFGIVSHDLAAALAHRSVAMPEVQDRRAKVVVPNTKRRLHSYANLYIYSRNKMMSKVTYGTPHKELCVIRVDKSILHFPSAVVADQNASSEYVRFSGGIAALRLIDKAIVFARSWKHPGDQIREWRHGSAMCAEVLIPDVVPPNYIMGVYVSCDETASLIRDDFSDLDVLVNSDLFLLTGW